MASTTEEQTPLLRKLSIVSESAPNNQLAGSVIGASDATQLVSSVRPLTGSLRQSSFNKLTQTAQGVSVRQPIQYRSAVTPRRIEPSQVANPSVSINVAVEDRNHPGGAGAPHVDDSATMARYRYYTRLAPGANSTLLMPNHVVPNRFYLLMPFVRKPGEQSSLVTIFSIWNTMMGTSLLSIPWALQQAGFACGLALTLIMTAICFYTALIIIRSGMKYSKLTAGGEDQAEFSDICRKFLGRPGYWAALVFSLLALMGAMIVYWVLLTNFMYNAGEFIYSETLREPYHVPDSINSTFKDVLCPGLPAPTNKNNSHNSTVSFPPPQSRLHLQHMLLATSKIPKNHSKEDAVFRKYWSEHFTVPLYLVAILFPLVNIKSPTFFTKFNALGTVSVVFLLVFVCIKATTWGIHFSLDPAASIVDRVPMFKWGFPALTGVLSLALFIHNCVITIMRNQKHPSNNGRDLGIAYVCVSLTYIILGGLFYVSFPLDKDCISGNLLNNIAANDILAFAARVFLFLQMLTVFPLITYIIRLQFFLNFFGKEYPSVLHVVLFHVLLIAICVLFAIFLPQIQTIIRYSGALCGLAYDFALPCFVYLFSEYQADRLKWWKILFNGSLIGLGVANFLAQFFV